MSKRISVESPNGKTTVEINESDFPRYKSFGYKKVGDKKPAFKDQSPKKSEVKQDGNI